MNGQCLDLDQFRVGNNVISNNFYGEVVGINYDEGKVLVKDENGYVDSWDPCALMIDNMIDMRVDLPEWK